MINNLTYKFRKGDILREYNSIYIIELSTTYFSYHPCCNNANHKLFVKKLNILNIFHNISFFIRIYCVNLYNL